MPPSTILLCFFIYIVDLNKAGLFERGFSGKGSSQTPPPPPGNPRPEEFKWNF